MSAIKKLTKLENGNYQILVELDLGSYTSSQWKKAIDYVNETLQSGDIMLCELSPNPLYQFTEKIDIENVSHEIVKCYEGVGSVFVELETIQTPKGQTLCNFIETVPEKLKFNWVGCSENTEVATLIQVYAEIT